MFMALALVITILVLCLLVVDLTRMEYVARTLQRSADAASLAGAVELVYSPKTPLERWKDAKRAVLASLAKNTVVFGYELPSPAQSTEHRGDSDACEPTGNYKSQAYDNGSLRIELERGSYTDDGAGTFESLEDTSTCNADSSDPSVNAVRVTVTLTGYPVVFGIPIGISGFRSTIPASSIGSLIE